MPAPIINFPLSSIVDGLLSYLQWMFGNSNIVPSAFLWDADDRKSLIRISAPFVIDNQKPMSAPFVIVERGGFTPENKQIDNLKSATPNTFEEPVYEDWFNGSINIICGAGTAGEASSLANLIAISMQADRKGIMKTLGFLRNFYYVNVGPEIPIQKDVEIRRWEVTVQFFASIKMSWFKSERAPTLWQSAAFRGIDNAPTTLSAHGSTTLNSDLLVDTTQDFGPLLTNNPQLLESELAKGYYYIKFSNQLYPILEIVDNHTLRLLTHDTNNQTIAWRAPATASGLSYGLWWNSTHIYMEIPKI